jgi:hypothetical protein
MPKKQYGVTTGGNTKQYFFHTTDDKSIYPTADECGPGSSILLKDAETKTIVGSLIFDGTDWNTVWNSTEV